jgi:hypothetical protein
MDRRDLPHPAARPDRTYAEQGGADAQGGKDSGRAGDGEIGNTGGTAARRDSIRRPRERIRRQQDFRFRKVVLDFFLVFRNIDHVGFQEFVGQVAKMQYFVVMIDYGRRGREAIVDPEITRRDVVSRIASGEYKNISFIHEIADSSVEDITADILSEAALPDVGTASADLQASHFDHLRDLRKHETV